jgi:hypothetical protein
MLAFNSSNPRQRPVGYAAVAATKGGAMIHKFRKLFAAFQESDHKIAWLYDQWKWRYFTFRHKKHQRHNQMFDRLHCVDTAAELSLEAAGVPLADVARGNGVYRALTEDVFRAAMDSVKIDPRAFTFVDIGSGKGKVLFMASNLPFKRIIGIEYAAGLHEVAVRNVATYRSESQQCTEIEPLYGDALAYTPPPGPLVLFVFNALAAEFMRALLKKLDQEAAAQKGRPVLLIYTNVRSVSEMGDAFHELTNLREIRRKRHFVVIANAAARELVQG